MNKWAICREAGHWGRARLRFGPADAGYSLGVGRGRRAGGDDGWPAAIVLMAVLAAPEALRIRRFEGDRFTRLLKEAVAERFVSGRIDGAITAGGCAVAHSVTKIADIGDMDHLVATPGSLWVVETKYCKVPIGRFAEVLRRMSVNAAAVRRWVPPGVSVRGCLVLATADGPPNQHSYEDGAWKFWILIRRPAGSIVHPYGRQATRTCCSPSESGRWRAMNRSGGVSKGGIAGAPMNRLEGA